MTVDVATLVFEFKSDSAAQAEKAMDRLIERGDRLDGVAKRVRLASDRVNEAHRGAAGAAERAAQGAMALVAAEGALEKATRASGAASAELRRLRALDAAQMREIAAQQRAAAAEKAALDRAAAAAAREAARERAAVDRQAAAEARSASAAVREARALETAAMRELVAATKAYERDQAQAAKAVAAAAREQAAAVQSLEARIFALKSSIDPTFAAQSRLDAELKEATALYKMGAISASDYAKAVGILDARMAAAARGQDLFGKTAMSGAASARFMQRAGLDLSRQFADIGVTAAMGMHPLMILIQQGPQIADIFVQGKMQGIGFTGMLRGMLGPLAGVGSGLLAVVGLLAAGAVGFGLLNRELSKGFPKDVTIGLNLTAEQLDRVKHKTVEFGDVFKATLYVAGKYLMTGPLGDGIRAVMKLWNDFLDGATKFTFEALATITGVFMGAFRTIQANWRNLPAVLGDAFAGAVNIAVDHIQRLVNSTIASLNLAKKGAALFVPGMAAVPDIPEADFSRFKVQASGAAKFVGTAFRENVVQAIEDARGGMRKLGAEISAGALKLARDRALKEAGKANKVSTPGTPRDMSDEQSARIAAQVQQAFQDELQARRAITREAIDRAEIERGIVQAALAEKQARIDQQIAAINDQKNKGLDAAEKAELTARLRGVKLVNEITATLQTRAIDEGLQADLAKQALDSQRAGLQSQMDLLGAQADLMQSAYARSFIEADILKLKQQEERAALEAVTIANGYNAAAVRDAQQRLAYLAKIQPLQLREIERQQRLVNAIGEATDAVRGFKDAFRRHDWARVFDELQRTIETIKASFAANGLGGGLLTAGSAAASLFGGKTGRAVSNGLGIAGLGVGLGGMLTTGALPAVGALTAALGVGTAGAIGGLMSTIGAALGPIGLAAGALYAAAKLFNVGGKPTNAGAGYDLRTGAISGNKRTSETEQAATSAGQAVQGIMDAVKAAGIGLTDALDALVVGTRDQSYLYFKSGAVLRSAVGDSGAAVDAAMKHLLESATYVSEAQEKLVKSALAAGKGFDDIANILAAYEAAQKVSGSLADQILQLQDPKAFDLQAVSRDIEEQRKAYKALADQGYLTADQLLTINGQLATLEGLRLDEVMKRYADSVGAAANDNLATLHSATESAEGMLMDAYNAFAEAKRAEIEGLRQSAESLKAFRKELDFGAIAGRGPVSQLAATRREFERLSALDATNPERLANLQAVSQAFLEASKVASPTQLAFDRDLAAVRRATEASQLAATAQADMAQMELDAQTAAVGQLIQLNATTVSIAQGIANLLVARANEKAAGGAVNDNLDVGRYLASNPDLVANWNAGGIMRSLGGSLEEAVRAQYAGWGKNEIAQGLRSYATGGTHPGGLRLVGEEGPEIEATGPARIYSARETARMMGGDNAELIAEVRALREQVADLQRSSGKTAYSTASMDARGRTQEVQGIHVRGETPGDPVITSEAA